MKKFLALALLVAVCAAPAFARYKKPQKDSRFAEHPKAYHAKNRQFKQAAKHKTPKHNTH